MGENRAEFPTGAGYVCMKRTVEQGQSVSYTLSCAVAEFEECSPTELPPLQEVLDVDALDTLFAIEAVNAPSFEGSLAFDYSDYSIVIRSDRSITVSVTDNMMTTLFEDDPPSATEDVARLRLQARHRSLAELEADEVVKWDREDCVVRKGRRFYEVWDDM